MMHQSGCSLASLLFTLSTFFTPEVAASAEREGAGALPPGTEHGARHAPQPTEEPTAAEKDVQRRSAEIAKFVKDHDDETAETPEAIRWSSKEGPEKSCKVERGSRVVHLTFRADGTLHCKSPTLAQGYKVRIWVLTLDKYAGEPAPKESPGSKKASHYLVTAKEGAALPSGIQVRGAADDAKAAIAFLEQLAKKAAATVNPVWDDLGTFGPYAAVDVTFHVELKEAAIAQDTKVTVAQLYTVNLAVAALGGPGNDTYSVANGAIQRDPARFSPDYYLALEVYPFGWHDDGNDHVIPARHFDRRFVTWYDRFSLVAGISISHPTERLFVGGGYEVIDGLSLTAGWQPRRFQKLKAGYAEGQAIQGTDAPVDHPWDWSGWGLGIAVDASIAKTITSAFK